MQQIFQDKSLTKKNKWLINIYIITSNLSWKNYKKSVWKWDAKKLLIRNYCYLFKLNNLNKKIESEQLVLLQILFANCFTMNLTSEEIDWLNNFNDHFSDTFKELKSTKRGDLMDYIVDTANSNNKNSIKSITDSRQWCMRIGETFYQAFKDQSNSELYYDYGYYWSLLLSINIKLYVFNEKLTADLLKLKLVVTNCFLETISAITPLYFNNFIIQNNFYIRKIKRKFF